MMRIGHLMNKLILVRGIIGSGKSTYAKSLNIFHVEADMYFQRNGSYQWDRRELGEAHSWCKETVKYALDQGMDVVVSNTFTTLREIQPYIDMGYPIEIVKMSKVYGNIHNVPDQIADMMLMRWQDIPEEVGLVEEVKC